MFFMEIVAVVLMNGASTWDGDNKRVTSGLEDVD